MSGLILDILLLSLIALVCFFILRGLVRRARSGRRGCSGDCASCGGYARCRSEKKEQK